MSPIPSTKEYQELSAIIEARYAPEFKVVEVPDSSFRRIQIAAR